MGIGKFFQHRMQNVNSYNITKCKGMNIKCMLCVIPILWTYVLMHIVFTVWILFYLCQTILVLLHCDKTLISFVKVWCTKTCLEIFSVYLSPKNVYNFYSIENLSLTYDLSTLFQCCFFSIFLVFVYYRKF